MKFRLFPFVFVLLLSSCRSPKALQTSTHEKQQALQGDYVEIRDLELGYRAWIPKSSEPIRAVIIASMGANWDYRHFAERPAWQAAAQHWQVALIGTDNRKGALLKKGNAAVAADLLAALDQLAEQSQRPELKHAALCSFGFSRGGGYSFSLAEQLPDRMIALGAGGTSPNWAPLFKSEDSRVKAIPMLIVQGDEDALAKDAWFHEIDTIRARGFRIALAGQWGLSHFEGNYENLMLFHVDSALKARLDPSWNPLETDPILREIPLAAGWLGMLTGAEKWSTWQPEIHPARDLAEEERAAYSWFIDESFAKAWQSYAPRQNAVMLRSPYCDSVDYIASRELPAPHSSSHFLHLEARSYWFKNVKQVRFYAGSLCIATGSAVEAGEPDSWEANWKQPTPGVHAIYAVFENERGERCPTKPFPLVVTP